MEDPRAAASLNLRRRRAASTLDAVDASLRAGDAEGYVLEDDKTTRSAAVHQWDRFGIEFHEFVSKLGRDVRT